jgi:glycerol-3-phosphate acyltransferase PlsX
MENSKKIKIAVDAMGGDYAPENVIEGAIMALRESNNRFEIVFVGDEKKIKNELRKYDTIGLNYSIVDAPQVIGMDDIPTVALRRKKNSSIVVGMKLHSDGEVDAFASAGNTGAVLTAATFILGRIEGISRPTIGSVFPTESGRKSIMLDVGANVDCKPNHLFEFAIMGSIYSSEILGQKNPKVALLNIGEESTKGGDVVLQAYQLLSESKLNFVGNVEGRDILLGKADVIVCDGFVGNIVLKFAESVLGVLKRKLRNYAMRNIFRRLTFGLLARGLRKALKEFDYQEYGGVPFLGVNGVAIIGHGSSTAVAIKNMIYRAEETVYMKINQKIKEALKTYKIKTEV